MDTPFQDLHRLHRIDYLSMDEGISVLGIMMYCGLCFEVVNIPVGFWY